MLLREFNTVVYRGVSQTGFRGTFLFRRTYLEVPREIVEEIHNYSEIPQTNYNHTFKYRENFLSGNLNYWN
jgi:hypothetical protein